MNDEQATNYHTNDPQTVSSRAQRLVEQIKKQLTETHSLLPEAIEQFLLSLPEKYQQMAIHTIAEQFVTDMKIHLLRMAATFYQQAEEEGIDTNERTEVLEDVEADIHDIMMLNQHLAINTLGDLFKLGKITTNVQDLSQSESAEDAQRGLYSVPGIYQGRLEREQLTKKEFSATIPLPTLRATMQVKFIPTQHSVSTVSFLAGHGQSPPAKQQTETDESMQWKNFFMLDACQSARENQIIDSSIEVKHNLSA